MNTNLRALLPLLALAAATTAQTWTYPLDPRAAYLRTNSDQPQPPLVLGLATLGLSPGQWLRIATTGDFRYVNGGTDTYRSLCGVFSTNATLLATNVQQRVPGAIAAGPAFPSGGTYSGSLPMDIPQDFFASRNLWDNGVEVEIPNGATHLFLGVHDSLYNDNVDPDGDYGVVVTLLPTPVLPGTGEHVVLASSVGGTPAPQLWNAPAGSTVTAQLRYPLGFVDGALYAFVGDTMATGGAVPQLLPRLWMGNLLVLQFGLLPATPSFTDSWQLQVPAGLNGVTLLLQGGVLTTAARNGTYETTDAHRFVLQ
jgi:hypothetical protein